MNLYKVREMDPDPLLQRLIDAYDADCTETTPEEDGTDEPAEE